MIKETNISISTWTRFTGRFILILFLTFSYPTLQWLMIRLTAAPLSRLFFGSVPMLFLACLWYWKTDKIALLPDAPFWRGIFYLGGAAALCLLPITVSRGSVSTISGHARSSFEGIEVIIITPIVEEIIFRGILWAFLKRALKKENGRILIPTSLLFGVQHLVYWMQAGWPLPFDALLHVVSMVGAGACYGELRRRSDSLAVPITAHMLANSIVLLSQ